MSIKDNIANELKDIVNKEWNRVNENINTCLNLLSYVPDDYQVRGMLRELEKEGKFLRELYEFIESI